MPPLLVRRPLLAGDVPAECRPTCSCTGSTIVLGASQLAAGYADRIAVLEALGSVAIALCARHAPRTRPPNDAQTLSPLNCARHRIEAPKPCMMFEQKHNRGVRPSCAHGWARYANLTVADTNEPLIVWDNGTHHSRGNSSIRGRPVTHIVEPTVARGLTLAREALAAGRCFRWELLPRRYVPVAAAQAGGARDSTAAQLIWDAEAAASRSFEFHWFRGEHEWQKDALVKALHLPWGDDYAQQGHAYTSGCVHAEPSRTVLDLVQSADDELLGQQYATVHVRRGDTRAQPGSSEYEDFKSRTGGLKRVLGELLSCDTSAASIGDRLRAKFNGTRQTPQLVFFTDETDDEYLAALRAALAAANVSEGVLHGDAVLRARAGAQSDNFLIYAASLIIRERAEWEWRWDRQDCFGSRLAQNVSKELAPPRSASKRERGSQGRLVVSRES